MTRRNGRVSEGSGRGAKGEMKGLGWAGLGWAGLGWAGLGWAAGGTLM